MLTMSRGIDPGRAEDNGRECHHVLQVMVRRYTPFMSESMEHIDASSLEAATCFGVSRSRSRPDDSSNSAPTICMRIEWPGSGMEHGPDPEASHGIAAALAFMAMALSVIFDAWHLAIGFLAGI